MPLPKVITSGTTPSWSTPQNFPVRPKPVIISSAMKSAPSSLAIARTAGRKPGGGMTLPAVPCIGSTMMAAMSPPDWFLMTSRDFSAQAMPQSGYVEVQRAAVAVGVGRRVRARHQRAEPVLEVAPHERQHAAGLAVEAAPEAHELVLLRDGLGQAERRLDGLGAAREELDAREALRRDAGEQVEELRADLRGEAAEREPAGLLLERLHVVRVAVADASDGDAGDEVDVGVAVLVEDPAALAARHREARIQREGLQARRHVAGLERRDALRTLADLEALVGRLGHRVTPTRLNRAASSAAMCVAATGRKSAKLGQAFRSITEMPPPSETIASPP